MNRITTKEKIEALEHVRKKLVAGKANYFTGLCGGIPYTTAGDYLRAYIRKQLGKHTYLSGWLQVERPSLLRSAKNMKKYRIQWIDWMIDGLKKGL